MPPNPSTRMYPATRVVQLAGVDLDLVALWGRPAVSFSIGTPGLFSGEDSFGDPIDLDLTMYPPGYIVPFQVSKIFVSGTTCTGVIAYHN